MLSLVVDAQTLHLRAPFALEVELPETPAIAKAAVSGAEDDWLELSVKGSEPWEFGRQLALGFTPGTDWARLALDRNLTLARSVSPTLVLLDAGSPRRAITVAAELATFPGVHSALPVCRRPAAVGFAHAPAPNDDFFPSQVANVQGQWYLENRDPVTGAFLGADVNARGAWAHTRGLGVGIAVGDLGIELTHPELAESLIGMPHFNYGRDLPLGTPVGIGSTGAHGTSCAGLIAGAANNVLGMSGLAPEAQLASWVVFRTASRLAADEALAGMYATAQQLVSVQNHSWGNASARQFGPTALEHSGIETAVTTGRGGLGTVLVRIAGNGRTTVLNANDDGWANDPLAICVAAVGPKGRAASYSSTGACILLAAPGGDYETGGLFTTDLTSFSGANPISFFPPYEYLADYRFNSLGMIGTSAAAPLVSAAAGLMLSVNSRLTARDVQQVLALSARHFDLADPSLVTNAAGLRVSHHTGFGVLDAGEAVRLAQRWVNRPAATTVRITNAVPGAIADSQLRVELRPNGQPESTVAFVGLPGTGAQPDGEMPFVRLVDLGLATNAPAQNLGGAGALIARGANDFTAKLAHAAAAGASFAVIYNYAEGSPDSCPPGEQLCPLGGTDFSPTPAIFVRRSAGLALKAAITNPAATGRLSARGLERTFTVAESLSCEHVQVRLRTSHPLRGDLRVILTAPTGTPSVLQTYGTDTNAGPADWTYMSTQHFFEPTAGEWRLNLVDEGEGAEGGFVDAELLLHGVPLADTDRDGLDDAWERARFGSLDAAAVGDADADGYSNLREFIAGSDPRTPEYPLTLRFDLWNPAVIRLSWPGMPGRYRLWAGDEPSRMSVVAEPAGTFPETEWMAPLSGAARFYQIERLTGTDP
jgi:subtilisin family serine protease/subtilisin-like proprotein convertase family protein